MSPAGTWTVTFSPFFLPSNARPTGLSLLIRPSVGLASVEPTMVKLCEPSGPVTLTVEPIWTWSLLVFSSIRVAFLMSDSTIWMRPSTNACSFLASSYSAFSVRSPCSLASWIRWAISGRLRDTISSSSWRSFSRPSLLMYVGLLFTVVVSLAPDKGKNPSPARVGRVLESESAAKPTTALMGCQSGRGAEARRRPVAGGPWRC